MASIAACRPRRRAPRRGVLLRCQVVREGDFRLVSDLAFDLSPDGMLVSTETATELEAGDELLVSFQVPRSTLWIDATAEVARVLRGHRSSDPGPCVGLCFVGLAARERERLTRALRGLPLAEPGRSGAS